MDIQQTTLRLMIVAGEASGDKHGAHLVEAMRTLRPDLRLEFFGAGGDEMRAAGVETIVDVRELAIMGALEIAAALPKFLRVFKQLREAAQQRHPDAVILIDWPEFNLRLAKKLKRDGQRIFYYISPQVWAWRSYRVNAIKRDVERMLVILPFEQDYYQKAGVKVEYVGHPLLDSVRVTASRAEFCSRHKLDPERPIVAMLPGSRRKEVAYILPPMIEAARELQQTRPDLQIVIALAPTIAQEQIELITSQYQLPSNSLLITNDTYNAIAAAELAIVASGTATLETAIIGTPLIVVYKASALNWRIFWPLINVPFVGMPNLIAGREIAPELLQDSLTGSKLAACIAEFVNDEARLIQARRDLEEVKNKLGECEASRRAAQCLLESLSISGQKAISAS